MFRTKWCVHRYSSWSIHHHYIQTRPRITRLCWAWTESRMLSYASTSLHLTLHLGLSNWYIWRINKMIRLFMTCDDVWIGCEKRDCDRSMKLVETHSRTIPWNYIFQAKRGRPTCIVRSTDLQHETVFWLLSYWICTQSRPNNHAVKVSSPLSCLTRASHQRCQNQQ